MCQWNVNQKKPTHASPSKTFQTRYQTHCCLSVQLTAAAATDREQGGDAADHTDYLQKMQPEVSLRAKAAGPIQRGKDQGKTDHKEKIDGADDMENRRACVWHEGRG